MNCEHFNDRLYELLDETLDDQTQAAAQAHLNQCEDCRRIFLREEALAKSMRNSLDRATGTLALTHVARRNILNSLEAKPGLSKFWAFAWRKFVLPPKQLIAVSVTLLLVLLLLLVSGIYRRLRVDSATQSIAGVGHTSYIVDVPIQTQTLTFRVERNTIVDTLVPDATVGRAYFVENNEQ